MLLKTWDTVPRVLHQDHPPQDARCSWAHSLDIWYILSMIGCEIRGSKVANSPHETCQRSGNFSILRIPDSGDL